MDFPVEFCKIKVISKGVVNLRTGVIMTDSKASGTDVYQGRQGKRNARIFNSFLRKLVERHYAYPGKQALEFLDFHGTELVLDAGSGSGFYTFQIAERLTHGKILALDSSAEMLRVLRKEVLKKKYSRRVEALECNILDVPLADEIADAAVSFFTWHYIENPLESALELFRMIKPGGKVFICDFNMNGSTQHSHNSSDSYPKRPFTQKDMKNTLEEAGFSGVRAFVHHNKLVLGTGVKPL